MRKHILTTLPLLALAAMPAEDASAFGLMHPPEPVTGFVYAYQPPDQIDQFLQALVKMQVLMVLDESCSMNDPAAMTSCPYYQSLFPAANMNTKMHQLKASLTGCRSATDSVLNRWATRINFGMLSFDDGWRFPMNGGLDGGWDVGAGDPAVKLAAMKTAVLSLHYGSGTSMTRALEEGGREIANHFNNANSLQCRPNFIILLSDGNPNTLGGTFDYENDPTSAGSDSLTYGDSEPWCGAAYLAGTLEDPSLSPNCTPAIPTAYTDMLAGVTGDQDIKTYTIGFGIAGSGGFSPSNLQYIANRGEGRYFAATNASGLDTAFNSIINQMVTRTRVTYTSPTIQLDGLFSANDAYAASFKPAADGFWPGNIKHACLQPGLLPNGNFNTLDDQCFYMADPVDPKRLIANPNPIDTFSGSNSADSSIGGTGAKLFTKINGGAPWGRAIRTYIPGDASYNFFRPNFITPDHLMIHGMQRVYAVNRLNGHTAASATDGAGPLGWPDDITGRDSNDYTPVGTEPWSMGDPLNAGPLLLRFEGAPPQDYLFAASNDGIYHMFDAAPLSGVERGALIPGEILAPHPAMNFAIRDLFLPFDIGRRKPYLLDTPPRLFLDDQNGDLRIGAAEPAFVIAGAGRGGALLHLIPMSTFNSALGFSAANPVFPLFRQAGTHYADLGDMWAAPWLGLMRIGAAVKKVAVFGSGHIRAYDGLSNIDGTVTSVPMPSATEDEWHVQSGVTSVSCVAALTPIGHHPYCNFWFAGGYFDFAPVDIYVGPFDAPQAVAYRLVFDSFESENGGASGDRVEIVSSNGEVADALQGTVVGANLTTRWVYGDSIGLRIVLDGSGNGLGARGLVLNRIEYKTAAATPTGIPNPVGPANDSHQWVPSIFVVDLEKWNGPNGGPTGPDAATQAFRTGGATMDDGMLLRFTSDCGSATVPGGAQCFDASSPGPDYADLQYMKCPISSEVSVLDVAGRLDRAYVMDDCAQLWRIMPAAAAGDWKINRILALNKEAPIPAGFPDSASYSSLDLRKVHTRVDLVRSRCTGVNSIQIAFGTGDVQNPVNPALLNNYARRNFVGVVWDDGLLGSTIDVSSLVDVTAIPKVDPKIDIKGALKVGWYIRLDPREQMLRNPLVFAQTAYFKTFRASSTAVECNAGVGETRTFTIDSCTAEAVNDPNSDGLHPVTERASTPITGDIGMAPTLVANRDGVMVLTEHGSVNPKNIQLGRRNQFLNWRIRP